MPDVFDKTLDGLLVGYSPCSWYCIHGVGAATGIYCNLCGEQLGRGVNYPLLKIRQHRQRYEAPVAEMLRRDLVPLTFNENRALRMYAAWMFESDGIGNPALCNPPIAEALAQFGGLAIGALICAPRGYRVLRGAPISVIQFVAALQLARKYGPEFFDAVEAALDVPELLDKMIAQQSEGMDLWSKETWANV